MAKTKRKTKSTKKVLPVKVSVSKTLTAREKKAIIEKEVFCRECNADGKRVLAAKCNDDGVPLCRVHM